MLLLKRKFLLVLICLLMFLISCSEKNDKEEITNEAAARIYASNTDYMGIVAQFYAEGKKYKEAGYDNGILKSWYTEDWKGNNSIFQGRNRKVGLLNSPTFQSSYLPDIVTPLTCIQGIMEEPKFTLSWEMSLIFLNISQRFPETIVSLTGYFISPFSI